MLKDTNDGYTFLYPFGWQELTVDGQDVVLKDVIEPLESVSVNLIDTPRETVSEFGDIGEVHFCNVHFYYVHLCYVGCSVFLHTTYIHTHTHAHNTRCIHIFTREIHTIYTHIYTPIYTYRHTHVHISTHPHTYVHPQVAFTLADKVLTGPKQQVKIVSTNEVCGVVCMYCGVCAVLDKCVLYCTRVCMPNHSLHVHVVSMYTPCIPTIPHNVYRPYHSVWTKMGASIMSLNLQ